jgi:hypothetical protein
MLDKEICKKCVNANYSYARWALQDEQRWVEGRVDCPPKVNSTGEHYCWITVTTDKLSKHCPYKLEHAVSAGMNKCIA